MRAVICGAGIAGLALANELSAAGAEVVVLERTRGHRGQGYMIDFYGPGYDAMEAMGLSARLEDVSYHVSEASFVDEDGRRRAGVEPAQFASGPLLNLMRPDLEGVLREHLSADVDLRLGTSPVAIVEDSTGVKVTLDDGTDVDADVLVGADGIHSTVRRLVFGPESRFIRYLGFHTAAFTFESPSIHAAVEGRACLTDTVGRQMGFYGLRDGRVAAFGVHHTPDPTLPDNVRSAVRETYGGLGWVVPEALDKCPPSDEVYYDQVAQVVMPRWSKGRVVLVGDACYAVSLLAGLGASLGIAGAYVLTDRLSRAASIEEALDDYETLWRPVIEDKQKSGRDAARFFLPGSRAQLWMRHALLRAARLPVIKRYVAAVLAGKSTALIKNLRGIDGSHLPEHMRHRSSSSR